MRLLVVNSNTTDAVTERIAGEARRASEKPIAFSARISAFVCGNPFFRTVSSASTISCSCSMNQGS